MSRPGAVPVDDAAASGEAASAPQSSASPAWTAAVAAVALAAVDPEGLGGVRLRGPSGPAREKLFEICRSLLPAGSPFRKLPVGVADARLLGGLDLAGTLSAGRPILERGLLAEADGGVLVVASAERMSAGLAGRLALAIDQGAVAIERDGFAATLSTRFATLACDEALADEEPPPAVLTERLGLVVSLGGVTRDDLGVHGPSAHDVAAARSRLGCVRIAAGEIEALAEAADRLGVGSLRPLLFAASAARASAALAGRDAVDDADLSLAARLVLGPRATRAPSASEEEEESADPAPSPPDAAPSDDAHQDETEDEAGSDPRELAETIVEAAVAALPAGLLETGAAIQPTSQGRAPGRAGPAHASKRRGRPIGARAGAPGGGARLDLLETLRAAAPWQRIRRRQPNATLPPPLPLAGEGKGTSNLALGGTSPHPSASRPPSPASGRREERILVRREDFRVKRLKDRRRTVTIFAVDASGSAALHRLAEAKGAVELLLAQSYVRRDEVALVTFRGQSAEIMLAPTRSLARAKRALSGLAGGGGTPLASGLDATAALADLVRRRGDQPTLVVLTDGVANVARDGAGGRARAQDEALAAARALRFFGIPAVVIDVSPRPQAKARELAEAMAARYVPLPSADASALARAAAPTA